MNYLRFSQTDNNKTKEAVAGNWIAYSGKWEKDTNWQGWTPLKEGLKKTFDKSKK